MMSFGYKGLEPMELAKRFKEEQAGVIKELKTMHLYWEESAFIFAHAGINLDKEEWKETRPSDFMWIRNQFHTGINETGKTIIFGHTPTRTLREDGRDDVWISRDGTKIGIDGGAVFGGSLIGLHLALDNTWTARKVHKTERTEEVMW